MIEHIDPLPRVSLGGNSKLGIPEGYIGAEGLLEHLIKIWWGVDLSSLGIEIEGHQVAAESRLGRAAATGQMMGCARVVQEAGESGKIRGLLPYDPAGPLTANLIELQRHNWSACDLNLLASDLMTGVVGRIDGQWLFEHNKRPLLFECSRTEAWLRELCSLHLLRQPLFADPATLPARSYVTLSEAVSWLVYGKVMSSDELDAKQLEDRRRVVRYAEDEDEEGETEFEFGEWFAAYLAALVRLEDVDRILRDAKERGDLGIREQGGGANWQGVQFARHDLERLWGSVAGGDSSGAAETSRLNREGAASTGGATAPSEVVPTRKRGRPGKGDKAATVYVKRFLNGHEVESLTLQGACDEIVKSGGKRVVPKTLARALKARGIQ